MRVAARFVCPSSGLGLSALLRKSTGVLWVCLGLGVAIHLSFTAVRGLEAEEKVSKPLTTQFVKRQPRLTKPLELKKRPQPKRRRVERTMVAVEARLERGKVEARFQPVQVLKGLARPRAEIGRIAGTAEVGMEPSSVAEAFQGAKEVEQRIDMSLELLDITALDTGQYHAMVVQSPEDKRNVKGFCHLAIANLPQEAFLHFPTLTFEEYVLPGFYRVVQAMNQYTEIKTDILGRLSLDKAELFKAPWLYFTAQRNFRLGDVEVENVRGYLKSGGFIFAEGMWDAGIQGTLNNLCRVLEAPAIEDILQKLPNSHPIYHCYFDFSGPPIGGDGAGVSNHEAHAYVIGYLEGIEADGRLVAIFTRKNYVHAWTFWGPGGKGAGWGDWDPKGAFQFAVNTIVFALTQEGSITRRLMDSVQ